MSCNEQSLGKILIPAKEWSKLKASFELKYKEHLNSLFEKSIVVYNEIKLEMKGKRNYDFNKSLNDKLYNDYRFKKLSDHDKYILKDALIRNKTKSLQKPAKKQFDLKNNKKENKERKTIHFTDDCLSLIFDNKERMVIYSTEENNNAVDYADSSFIGSTILKLLDRVEYTSHTGGYFRYQSEYDTDSNGFSTGSRIIKRYGKYSTVKFLYEEKCTLF